MENQDEELIIYNKWKYEYHAGSAAKVCKTFDYINITKRYSQPK